MRRAKQRMLGAMLAGGLAAGLAAGLATGWAAGFFAGGPSAVKKKSADGLDGSLSLHKGLEGEAEEGLCLLKIFWEEEDLPNPELKLLSAPESVLVSGLGLVSGTGEVLGKPSLKSC
jgi:hypothetical protein